MYRQPGAQEPVLGIPVKKSTRTQGDDATSGSVVVLTTTIFIDNNTPLTRHHDHDVLLIRGSGT